MGKQDVFQRMGDRWEAEVVARTEIGRFSGGMLSSKYLANLDSMGQGPARIACGRKVGYPVNELVAWLRARSAG